MAAEIRGSCVFCEILAGRAPARRIHEDQHSLAILDINPFARGHCLVLSKRHVPWWHDLTEEEIESLFRVARFTAGKIRTAFQPEFVCMYARGRRVPHTHVFLVPTSRGDLLDRFFNDLERAQESSQELAELREQHSLDEVAARLTAL